MATLWQKLVRNFDLNGATPVFFWKSEWERFDPNQCQSGPESINPLYLAYRFLFMAFFLTVTIQNWLCDPHLYFIYLTNLSFLVQLIHATFYFLVLLCIWLAAGPCACLRWPELDPHTEQSQRLIGRQDPEPTTSLPLPYKIVWILTNITSTIPFGVTAVYWLAVYDGDGPNSCENVLNYFLHIGNSIAALLDTAVIAIPVRWTHAVFPFIAGAAYVLFSVLYEVLGGVYKDGDEYLYSILDWRNAPWFAALVSVLVLLAAVLIHFGLCWGLATLRQAIVRKYFTERNNKK